MIDACDLVRCPLCAGHGEVRRSHVSEFFADPELKIKIDAYLSESSGTQEHLELVCSSPPQTRDFQKDVHSWNPQLPMWRRSPKE
jgi:hypothetical protein